MTVRIFALFSILSLCLAGTAAAAGKGLELTAGGRTVAGPGSVAVASEATVAVADGLEGRRLCATVANRSRGSSVLVELIGNTTDSQTVDPGSTLALCMDNTDTVQVTCQVGSRPSACSVDWRVDEL